MSRCGEKLEVPQSSTLRYVFSVEEERQSTLHIRAAETSMCTTGALKNAQFAYSSQLVTLHSLHNTLQRPALQ